MRVTAAVLAVGDELLLGDTVNTNAAWLGRSLAAAGVTVVSSAMVGDDLAALTAALQRCVADADVVLVTGGLGPTSDDRTRDAVAAVAGVPLERLPAMEQQLRDRFADFGFPMPPDVLRQADVPVGASVIANPVGTAPGLRVEVSDTVVYAVPGPPHELQAVAGPVLDELASRSGLVLHTRTLHAAGRGESAVAEQVEQVVRDIGGLPDGVVLAYLAGGAVVRVRFTGTDVDDIAPVAVAVAAALGEDLVGVDDDDLVAVVSRLLRDAGATVAAAESLTGGLLTSALVDRPGASDVVRGAAVVYAEDLKTSMTDVPAALLAQHGAVSAEVATAMAEGARARLGATYGVSTTGVAGPEPADDVEAGTVHVAVAGPGGTTQRSVRLPGDRTRVRALAVTTALDLLRRVLLRDGTEGRADSP